MTMRISTRDDIWCGDDELPHYCPNCGNSLDMSPLVDRNEALAEALKECVRVMEWRARVDCALDVTEWQETMAAIEQAKKAMEGQ